MAIRFFEWSSKHKRKKRSRKPNGHGTMFYNAPKEYSHFYIRKDRSKEGILMRMFKNGKIDDDSLEDNLPRDHKNGATWDFW